MKKENKDKPFRKMTIPKLDMRDIESEASKQGDFNLEKQKQIQRVRKN